MNLEIQNLSKTFQQGTTKIAVLDRLNLHAEGGEQIAILGHSGSGKSTLLSLLAGLDTPTSGRIQVADSPIHEMNQDALALWRGKNVGIVFQQYHLLPHLTALENVRLPLEIQGIQNPERAENLLKELGLAERLNHLPRQLSGGECQRVAIARALASEPRLILADEPSGNLDTLTGRAVMEAFFRQVKGAHATTILVTHNQELAERCQRRYLLENGRLRELP